MIISLRNWIRRIFFILLLIVLTVAVFMLLRIVAGWFAVPDPYAKPQGHAVKAFEPTQDARADASFADRLRWFYLFGE